MQDWKITIAEGIISYSKSGSKDVKIVTKDNKTGAAVAQAMQANMKQLCADFKGISRSKQQNWWNVGLAEAIIGIPGVGSGALAGIYGTSALVGSGWKTFFVETGSKQAQEQLMNNIKKIKSEVSEYKNGAVDIEPSSIVEETGIGKYVWIVAAVLAVAAIVWALKNK